MKTELKDRTLWYDGTSQVLPELVPGLLLCGVPLEKIVVTQTNQDVIQYNLLADLPLEAEKVKNHPLDLTWLIPQSYTQIKLDLFLGDKLVARGLSDNPEYASRLSVELEQVQLRGMEPLVKTLIYVVDKFKESKTVWGVGRGSSCASLILFLIDLHKVDPVKYNISMEEFFHD
jgi:DNA polymerase III alpha subunit